MFEGKGKQGCSLLNIILRKAYTFMLKYCKFYLLVFANQMLSKVAYF